MKKWYFLILASNLFAYVNAQMGEWTKSDSVWLQRILSGENQLQLNDYTRNAIRQGTLISNNMESVPPSLNFNPTKTFVIKIIENSIKPDLRSINPIDMPTSVYLLYNVNLTDSLTDPSRSCILDKNTSRELKTLYISTHLKITVDDPISIRSGFVVKFDAEDLLRTVFWASHRAKKRNSKRSMTWKTYYDGY